MSRRTRNHALALTLLLAGLASPSAARAQDPVLKPRTTVAVRPALPSAVAARQLPDGRIQLVWTSVAGAESYQITRSVPGVGAGIVSQPNPADTVYHDSDVVAGRTYYYVVAGVNGAGLGLKKGAPPVTATRSAGGAVATASWTPRLDSVRAWMRPENPSASEVQAFGSFPLGATVTFERVNLDDADAKGTWTAHSSQKLDYNGNTTSPWLASTGWGDAMLGKRVQFRATLVGPTGARIGPVLSNVVTIGSAGVAPGGTGAGTGSSLAPGTTIGQVTVSVATPTSISVGATASLAGALGGSSAIRWISLDEGSATVSDAGMVTGRAPGRAQILAVGRAADGTVRVTSVQVTVVR